MPTDTISDSRRPCRSAICPNSQPPSGRTMKPAANSVAALSCWTTGSCEGRRRGEVQREGGVGVEVVPLDQVAHGTDENGLDAALRVGDIQMRASWRSCCLPEWKRRRGRSAPPPACPILLPAARIARAAEAAFSLLSFWGAWTTPAGALPRGLIGSQGAACPSARAFAQQDLGAAFRAEHVLAVVAHAAHFVAGAVQRDRLAAARCEQELVLQVGGRAPAAWSPGPRRRRSCPAGGARGCCRRRPAGGDVAPRSARTAGIPPGRARGGQLVGALYWL